MKSEIKGNEEYYIMHKLGVDNTCKTVEVAHFTLGIKVLRGFSEEV